MYVVTFTSVYFVLNLFYTDSANLLTLYNGCILAVNSTLLLWVAKEGEVDQNKYDFVIFCYVICVKFQNRVVSDLERVISKMATQRKKIPTTIGVTSLFSSYDQVALWVYFFL